MLHPTTTAKMAERILTASRIVADSLPDGLNALPVLDILMELYAAEEDARYPRLGELDPPSVPVPSVTHRWVAALVQAGLVERRGDLLALTADGHTRVTALLQALYAAQRALD